MSFPCTCNPVPHLHALGPPQCCRSGTHPVPSGPPMVSRHFLCRALPEASGGAFHRLAPAPLPSDTSIQSPTRSLSAAAVTEPQTPSGQRAAVLRALGAAIWRSLSHTHTLASGFFLYLMAFRCVFHVRAYTRVSFPSKTHFA